MNITRTRVILKLFAAVALFIAANFSQTATASEHESACKLHIQDKIAWNPGSNYTSAAKWEEKNLDYLCRGTTTPKAPGECFHQVMTGHVSYGDSDKWDYKNAMELCKGTDNAEETVSCFKGKMADKVKWQDAIAQCQAKKPLENIAK